MNEIDFFAETGEIDGIFQSYISAAHYRYALAAEKGSVTGSAIGYPFPVQLFFSGDCQRRVDGACSQDDRFGLQISAIGADCFACPFVFDGQTACFPEFHAQVIRMFSKFHTHVKAVDGRQTQIVVHLVGIQHLTAAHGIFLQYQQIKGRPFGVYSGREPGRT